MKAKLLTLFLSGFFLSHVLSAQTDSSKTILLDLEFRPRIEYRNGYRQLPNDTTEAAYFGTQRSRLKITYTQQRFKFHTSIQDLRVWGQYGQVSTGGSLNVFEAYIESYFTENLFMRIGRQKVELDNGKIFSAADWSQAGRSQDGLNLIYEKRKVKSELMAFFNQASEAVFETSYSPTTFTNYKLLNVHFMKVNVDKHLSLTTINAADGYQSKISSGTLYVRGTSGGRLEFEKDNLYLTMSGYYQYGQLQSGKEIAAYYLQPEVKYKIEKFTTRLGAEYMSGDDATATSNISKSFIPLYGVTWKFFGNMDYFISFPNDLKNGGLINPYLFLFYDINHKTTVRADMHLFYLQNKVLDKDKEEINPYLGFENDLSIRFKINSFSTLDYGFSWMKAEQSMEKLKGGDSGRTPFWTYLMITFKPELFKQTLKTK